MLLSESGHLKFLVIWSIHWMTPAEWYGESKGHLFGISLYCWIICWHWKIMTYIAKLNYQYQETVFWYWIIITDHWISVNLEHHREILMMNNLPHDSPKNICVKWTKKWWSWIFRWILRCKINLREIDETLATTNYGTLCQRGHFVVPGPSCINVDVDVW